MPRPADQTKPDGLIINAAVLRFMLRYDIETGLFFWRHRRSGVDSSRPAGALNKGYITIRLFGRFYPAHRLAWLYVHGAWPTKMLDHINRDPSDNRIANLREAGPQENGWNSTAHRPGASGYVGVRFKRSRNAYEATLSIGGRKRHLGLFRTAEEANQHRLSIARQLRGEFFPGE